MTSQYVTEPPTSGLVELITSKGTISIELFSRECPLACRNFLTLALEGFYDGLIFHRIIPGFIIQSGDPSGTGTGGESIYGEPFAIEPHSRLKFNRRGLLAMAAEEKQNESQFFLTLDAAPELQGKHTLLGRVVGKSIYNLLELAEGVELTGDRPRYPPKLKEVRVVENPFDDLKPRMTKEQRRADERKRKQEAERRKNEEERKKRGKAKKNTALLSFGAEDEADEGALKGPKSSHDLLKQDKKLSRQSMEVSQRKKDKETSPVAPPAAAASARVESAPEAKQKPSSITASQLPSSDVKDEPQASTSKTDLTTTITTNTSSSKPSSGRDYLSQQRAKYSTSSTSKRDSYDALLSFQTRLRASAAEAVSSSSRPIRREDAEEEEEAREYGASDDDTDWREHRLDAGGKPLTNADAKDKVEDYEVLDPREHASAPQRDADRRRDGKRGRDWVEDERRYQTYRRSDDGHRERDRYGDRQRERHSSSNDKSRDSGRDRRQERRR